MANVKFTIFAGIQNTLPAERLHSLPTRDNPTCDLAAAVNVDIDNSGQVARRGGIVQKVAGAAHSLWAWGEVCLFVQGGALRRLWPDFSSQTLALGLTPDLPLAYVEVNGLIYWSNGAQSGVVEQRRNRTWGMDVPASPGLSATSGSLPAGTYQLVLTYLRRDGQESGAGMGERITLEENSGVLVSWNPPSDPGVTSLGIYMSEPNGMVMYQAAVVDVSDVYAEVTGPRLALPLNTQWLDKPPTAQALAWHRGRIYLAVGAFLFATTALGYEWCDLRDFLALDGTRISFVIGVEHGIFIGTAQKVYFLAGDKLDELSLKTVVPAAGLAGSAVPVDGYAGTGNVNLAGQQCVLFATGEGVCLGLPDGTVQHLTQERYRFDAADTGAACFRQTDTLNQYLLFQPG